MRLVPLDLANLVRSLVAIAATVAVSPDRALVWAQEPIRLNDPAADREKSRQLQAIRQAGTATAEELKMITQHFNARIAKFTWPELTGSLTAMRGELRRDRNFLFRSAGSQDLHKWLNEHLLKTLPRLIESDKYSPSARVNWTLVVGDLNEAEPDATGRGGKPLPAALPPLMALYSNAAMPPYVRLAAQAGIERYATSGMSDADRQRFAQALRAVLATAAVPQGVQPEVHQFMRRRAIDGLQLLIQRGQLAEGDKIVAAVHQFASDPATKLSNRCEAAATLGMIPAENVPAAVTSEAAKNFAVLVVDIIQPAKPADAVPAATDSAAADLPVETQEYLLDSVRVGIEGMGQGRGLRSARPDDATTKLLTELQTKIGEMRGVLKNRRLQQKDRTAQLQTLAQDVQALLQPMAGAASEGRAADGAPMQVELQRNAANP